MAVEKAIPKGITKCLYNSSLLVIVRLCYRLDHRRASTTWTMINSTNGLEQEVEKAIVRTVSTESSESSCR